MIKIHSKNQLDEVIREKKEQFCKFKKSGIKNRDPVAINNHAKAGETQGKYPDVTAAIMRDSFLNDIQRDQAGKDVVLKCTTFKVQRLKT